MGAGGEPAAQEESFTAWRRFLEGLAAQNPTVLVVDDLHWADAPMLAFLEHLADWSTGVPLLLLCTARPELHEKHSTWATGLRNAQTINLAPLSDEETATLIALLLQRTVLPSATQRALLDRAGGNPLYAEEFVRLLSDRNLLAGSLEEVLLPDSVQALIAARLDTLSAERKGLLQDAAVIGKVFWAGALAAMGAHDLRDVELALHELVRKELVRPSRSSSMQGEHEYGFWHLLVRDVCYAQIPRSSRAARHRAAAGWIERQAGDRVDDLSDMLAHHYVQALELARIAGEGRDIPELEAGARRFLTLAGARALPIDVASAETSFARALQLTPADHPERAALLERWADAAVQQGRFAEATVALEEALALHRTAGARVANGRTLTALSSALRTTGDPRSRELIAEAVQLLEAEEPGPELVSAYAQLARGNAIDAAYAEAIAAAERALELAARLGLAEPARALGYRGVSRAYPGDARGLADMRRALELATGQGLSEAAAVLYNNLALAAWQHEGPEAALVLCAEGIDFSERRGISAWALAIAGMRPTFLAACGEAERALADVESVVAQLEAAGDAYMIEARAVQLSLLAGAAARSTSPPQSNWSRSLVRPASPSRRQSDSLRLFKPCCSKAASSRPRRCSRSWRGPLAHAPTRTTRRRCPSSSAARSPSATRRSQPGSWSVSSPARHSSSTCWPPAARRSRRLPTIAPRPRPPTSTRPPVGGSSAMSELAYALLGQGRCQVALGATGADGPLREARDLFTSMGFGPALKETEALLERAAEARSSSTLAGRPTRVDRSPW